MMMGMSVGVDTVDKAFKIRMMGVLKGRSFTFSESLSLMTKEQPISF